MHFLHDYPLSPASTVGNLKDFMAVKTEKELSPNARNNWLKALSAFELKNFGYAITLLQSVLNEEPTFLAGRQLLRRAEFGNTKGKKSFFSGINTASLSTMKYQGLLKKDPAEAMKAAEKMLESDPGNHAANQLLKEAALALDMPEIAAFALETLREAHPKDTKVLHELAKHYYEYDNPQKAVDVYNAILEIAPNDIAAVKGSKDASARLSMQKGNWEQEGDFRGKLKDQKEAESLEQINRIVKDEDVIQAQLVELGKQYSENPTNLDVVRKIASLYEQQGDLDNAIAYYTYAASLTNNTDAGLLRKATDLQLKQLDLKIRDHSAWLKANDPSTEGYAARQGEYEALRTQRAEMQISEAKRRVERNPTDLQLRYELGEVLMQAGHYKEALPELQKARQNPNARIKALNLLGQCMIQLGMLDLAENQFKTAVSEISSMDDTKKDLLYNLGLVYEKMGRKDDYIDCMKRIFEADFGYRDVADRVEKWYGAA
jgi:tetratricopeptide (TPR) repeat protein